jgi:hypothetical protein
MMSTPAVTMPCGSGGSPEISIEPASMSASSPVSILYKWWCGSVLGS